MTRTLFLALAVTFAASVAGCAEGLRFDASALAPVIGERNAGLLSAGGKFLSATSLSQKDEDSLGQSVGVALTNRFPLVADNNVQRYVNLVGLSVASASPNPGGNWVFGVVQTDEVNAFSGPNGYVFITSGALRRMQDEAELAGVLAHEISHVCNHDGLTQVKNNETKGALTDAMKAADSRTAQLAALTDNGIDVITRQGYDKKQEFQADHDGVQIMTAAGYNPGSYLAFLQRLQSQGGPSGGQLMSTHPGISERVARVSQQLQSLPRPAGGGATLATRFQQNTTNVR